MIPISSKNKLSLFRVKEAKKLVKNIFTLDLGGGDGWFISQLVNPKNVTVIDLNKEGLEKNRSKKKIFGNLTDIKLKSKSFSQITLFEVIEHIEKEGDRIKIFSNAYRLLKKGGKLIISTPNYNRLSTQLRSIIGKKRKYPYPVAKEKGVYFTDWHYFEYAEKTIKKDLEKVGFKKIKTYCKFIQIPYLQFCINIYSKYGLVLYAIAEK